ncbi:GTP-binding protein Rho1 [Thoreauomyces humboldtii]|nr:GTP-binding protein Rho1 [Thoreauomyces humboldtii]
MGYPSHLSGSSGSIQQLRKKLVIVGDGSAGKTSLLVVQAGNPFPEEYVPTIFENYVSRVVVKDKVCELSLWDTAGQEDYDRLRPLSYPDTDVVLLAFAVTERTSFGSVKEKWHPETLHFLPHVPRILVGCKCDLREDPGVLETLAKERSSPVSYEEGVRLAAEISMDLSTKVRYFETSAKTKEGVTDLFIAAAKLTHKGKKMAACLVM